MRILLFSLLFLCSLSVRASFVNAKSKVLSPVANHLNTSVNSKEDSTQTRKRGVFRRRAVAKTPPKSEVANPSLAANIARLPRDFSDDTSVNEPISESMTITTRNGNTSATYEVPAHIPIPERRIKTPSWQQMSTHSEPQTVYMAKEALTDPRIRAFLDLIARCEVADEGYDPESYSIAHGFARIQRYTTYHPGKMHKGSTASGRYQMLKRTFNPLVNNYPTANLSFRPEGQDLATVLLMHERSVLPYIAQNDILGAIKKASLIWASFPYYEVPDRDGNLSYYRNVHKNKHILDLYGAVEHYNRRLDYWLDNMPELYQTVHSSAPVTQTMPLNSVRSTPAVFAMPEQKRPVVVTPTTTQPDSASQVAKPVETSRRWKVSQN